jgi:hypothetical protein
VSDEPGDGLKARIRREILAANLSSDEMLALGIKMAAAIVEMEELAHRTQLLEAYRQRQRWRKADISKLQLLGAKGKHRMRLLASKPQRGRGIIPEPWLRPVARFRTLSARATTPAQRWRLHRAMPGADLLIEAAYRGEKEALKREGADPLAMPGWRAHEIARDRVAAAITETGATARFGGKSVDLACVSARRHYRERGMRPYPAIRAAGLERFLRTGELP